MRSTSFYVLALVLGLGLVGCTAEDETAARKRETAEIEKKLGATKVTLYRVAKTAVRALPPRDRVRTLVAAAGKEELTRDEWIALLEKDPSLVTHKSRVGLFVAGANLREVAYAGVIAGAAVLAARGGGHMAGTAETPFTLPRTPQPFGGSPTVFVTECRDILRDDEDRYPTLLSSFLPEELAIAARDKTGPFATGPLSRIAVPAVEHLALGAAWIAFNPDFALYEWARARAEDLAPLEEAVLRAGRAWLFTKAEWRYHALDELAALEARLPDVTRAAAELAGATPTAKPDEAVEALKAVLHLLRAENYHALGRKEDAERELAAAGGSSKPAMEEAWRRAQAAGIPEQATRFAGEIRTRMGEQVATWQKSFPLADDLKDRASGLWNELRKKP